MRAANVKKKTVVSITFGDSSKSSGIASFPFKKTIWLLIKVKFSLNNVKTPEDANHSLAPIARRYSETSFRLPYKAQPSGVPSKSVSLVSRLAPALTRTFTVSTDPDQTA
jgi:hypothetical protein